MKLYEVFFDEDITNPYIKHKTHLVVAENEELAIKKAHDNEDYYYFDLNTCYVHAVQVTEVDGYEIILGKKKALSKETLEVLNDLL